MRSETIIRVKKPAWVRIVNPVPIAVLDMTYRYGEDAQVVPGGIFRKLAEGADRALAIYQAPHPPSDAHECPSDALLFYTLADFRLMAEGWINHFEPYDRSLPTRVGGAPAARVPLGAIGRVPKTRLVRPFRSIERIDKAKSAEGPFRERPLVVRIEQDEAYAPIRPGGMMKVVAFDGPMLKVVYRAVPRRGEQLASGNFFFIAEAEFLRMDRAYRALQDAEAVERALIIELLRSM